MTDSDKASKSTTTRKAGDAPLRGRLTLANGTTVEVEDINSTHHYDPATGQTVPVVGGYMLPADDDTK